MPRSSEVPTWRREEKQKPKPLTKAQTSAKSNILADVFATRVNTEHRKHLCQAQKTNNNKNLQKMGSGSRAGCKFKLSPWQREAVLVPLPSTGRGTEAGLPWEPTMLGTLAFHLAAGPVGTTLVASLGPRPVLRESSLQLRVPNCHLPMPKGKVCGSAS